jgi:hypothetical protein
MLKVSVFVGCRVIGRENSFTFAASPSLVAYSRQQLVVSKNSSFGLFLNSDPALRCTRVSMLSAVLGQQELLFLAYDVRAACKTFAIHFPIASVVLLPLPLPVGKRIDMSLSVCVYLQETKTTGGGFTATRVATATTSGPRKKDQKQREKQNECAHAVASSHPLVALVRRRWRPIHRRRCRRLAA